MADLHAIMRLDRERAGDAFTLLVEPDPWTVALDRDDALAVANVLTSGGRVEVEDLGHSRRLVMEAKRADDGMRAWFNVCLPRSDWMFTGGLDPAETLSLAADLRYRAAP